MFWMLYLSQPLSLEACFFKNDNPEILNLLHKNLSQSDKRFIAESKKDTRKYKVRLVQNIFV
jgi:hypothetical protein